mgnify:CR=1 FL=1
MREPLIRMTNWARAFGAASSSGEFQITSTSANTSLGQSPLTSPSVFNFFRPGYVPPGTALSAGAVAPEFQLVSESSVAGYLNFMQTTIDTGGVTGMASRRSRGTGRDWSPASRARRKRPRRPGTVQSIHETACSHSGWAESERAKNSSRPP